MFPHSPALTVADIGYGWLTEPRWWLVATMLIAAAIVTVARKGR
jgi:hypothetical protein